MSNQDEKKRLEELEAQFRDMLEEVMSEPDEIYGERLGKVDYSFLDENINPDEVESDEREVIHMGETVGKQKPKRVKKSLAYLSRAAVLALCILAAGSAMAIWINSEQAVAGKFNIQKMFYEIREGVFGTNENEAEESEPSNLIEVEYTNWDDIEKAKKLVPELLVPTYIPEGFEFERLKVEKDITGDFAVQFIYANKDKSFQINLYGLGGKLNANLIANSELLMIGDVETYIWSDEISANAGANFVENGILVAISGRVNKDEIIDIVKNLK